MDELVAAYYTAELLRTLECVHAAGIIHGDVKADNVLIRCDTDDLTYASPFDATGRRK